MKQLPHGYEREEERKRGETRWQKFTLSRFIFQWMNTPPGPLSTESQSNGWKEIKRVLIASRIQRENSLFPRNPSLERRDFFLSPNSIFENGYPSHPRLYDQSWPSILSYSLRSKEDLSSTKNISNSNPCARIFVDFVLINPTNSSLRCKAYVCRDVLRNTITFSTHV